MTVVDAQQRLAAVNPLRSFCVGAPAGSGKTELLIQRYLTLLTTVAHPEQVLAITFTRKAAAEMRDRVLQALEDADAGKPCDGAHQQHTRALAVAALGADAEREWQLVQNISRLNIKTIDSFCSQLTRQMPVLSEFGGQAEVVERAEELYAEAVAGLFKLIDTDNALRADLAALMLHFDNNWARLSELLTSMLARRDQWRGYIGVHHRPEEAEVYLLHTVKGIVADALADLERKLAPFRGQLLVLQHYSAGNMGATAIDGFPSSEPADLSSWRAIRTLLLTQAGGWRASVTKNMGFPPGKGVAKEHKEQLTALIGELREIEGLHESLKAMNTLPEMAPDGESWKLVLQLSRILPRLAAELLLVFGRHGKVDYNQVSLSALQALGDDDTPTELALRLDYQIEHILVDEFQDTAINQFELVRRLTRGWGEHNERNPDKPRTLLIVGDGMQSIYGFRNANVGLFLQARNEGFNGVALESINLHSNFRSDEGIVHWVNDTFADAFPATEDVSRGQIRFTPAAAVRPAGPTPAVSLQAFRGEESAALEVDAICEVIQRGVADEACKSIAILARSRGHLQPILARLKTLGVAYSAQDIDSLGGSSAVLDLLSLCRALANPADRVAWLSILRAPWCGLSLGDLHRIGTAGEVPAFTYLGDLLRSSDLAGQLTQDGRERIEHVGAAMHRAQGKRDRLALRVWIEQLWLELGGAATAGSHAALHDAERFFQLLEQAEQEGVGLSISWLETRLDKLYVQAENPASKVQVMTLHKAKGLEFDWVIIPALERKTAVNARPLLLWDDHSAADGERGFLLAADDHSEPGAPTLFNWLKDQRKHKDILEATRLLYVGTTRAVQRLFLTACPAYDERKEQYREPTSSSLLFHIWPAFREQMTVRESPATLAPATLAQPTTNVRHRPLYRLPIGALQQLPGAVAAAPAADDPETANRPERAGNRIDRYVGTVVHLALEQLSRLSDLPQSVAPADSARWQRALAALGLHGAGLESALGRVEKSVGVVLADAVGRWLLASDHQQAHSELPLTAVDEDGRVRDIIIDRTFIDRETNERWLIDYKNSEPEDGQTLEAFTELEAQKYRAQLALYRDALQGLDDQPVSCALYFTALAYMHRVNIQGV